MISIKTHYTIHDLTDKEQELLYELEKQIGRRETQKVTWRAPGGQYRMVIYKIGDHNVGWVLQEKIENEKWQDMPSQDMELKDRGPEWIVIHGMAEYFIHEEGW